MDGKKYYIINTEKKNSQHVSHWIVLYFQFGNCDFFYPLGNNINHYDQLIYQFMYNNCTNNFSYSTVPIQGPNSVKCGQFCLFFCYARCKEESFKSIVAYFETKTISQNDSIMETFYNWLIKYKNPFMCCGQQYL